MKLKFKKLISSAIIPRFATSGSACFDLHAAGTADVVYPGHTVVVRTGLSVELPAGHVMLIFSRSGHGFKTDVRLSNCVGVIDADYRGEICVKLCQDTTDTPGLIVTHGDRIAQGLVIPLPVIEIIEVDELSDTERGMGGFGSTGN